MATIEHRSTNSWRVGVRDPYDDKHKWIRKSISFPSSMPEHEQRRQAELAAAQLMLDVEEGRTIISKASTVREFSTLWIEEHVRPTCSPTTLKNYEYFLNSRILPALGDTQLQRLTPLMLTRFINDVRASSSRSTALPPSQRKRVSDRSVRSLPPHRLSERSVRHYYDCLNFMLSKAVQWGYLSENPMEKVDRPKIPKKEVHYLDDDQAVRLLRCLANEESLPFRCAVLLALLCGLRLGEVGALMLEDVNWKDCSINISRALKYTPEEGCFIARPKTDDSIRVIDLPAGMMALLEETRRYNEEAERVLGDRWYGCGRIVANWDGRPVHHDTPSKWFRKFADANGFEGVRFHDLRHTHATILLANNIDAVAVASRLGHADASTTLRIYAHAIRKRDRESAAAMQNLIERAFAMAAPAPDQEGSVHPTPEIQ